MFFVILDTSTELIYKLSKTQFVKVGLLLDVEGGGSKGGTWRNALGVTSRERVDP